MRNHVLIVFALGVTLSLLVGCETTNIPLMPIRTIEVDVPNEEAATAPAATEASIQVAATEAQPTTTQAATGPATQQTAAATTTAPSTHKITKVIDPNQTTKFVYKANYDRVWQQATDLLTTMGFRLDRQDYRLGVLTTLPLHSPEIVEFWRRDRTGLMQALENTVNSQRHIVRLTISTVPGKPKFYEIAVQALVERQTNPTETLNAPVFARGSGFGGDIVTLRSDYLGSDKVWAAWNVQGRDPALEKVILAELFKHI